MGGQLDRVVAQARDPLAVGVGGGADDMAGPADHDRLVGDDRARADEGALPQDAAVADPRPWHEDGAVADLAQIADAGADHLAAVPEDGPLTDRHRVVAGADDAGVLQHRRVVADRNGLLVGADDRALGQHRPSPDPGGAQHRRRVGEHGERCIRARTIQAHRRSLQLCAQTPTGRNSRGTSMRISSASSTPASSTTSEPASLAASPVASLSPATSSSPSRT
jgi:hypothetical protein